MTLPPWFIYIPNFLQNADELFAYFSRELDRKQYPITIFGKTMMQPRFVSFYADPWCIYTYSQTRLIWSWWDPQLESIKQHIQQKFWYNLNSVLCNLYRDGNDSMGRHSDDEPELWPDPHIASITLWTNRVFKIKHISSKENHDIILEHGSLLLMGSRSQLDRVHSIPKTTKIVWSRINLTFRKIV
jgi:alkylated DNA repair dioxygenase AlkB